MKIRTHLNILILVSLAVALYALPVGSEQKGVNWVSYEEGLKSQASLHKPMIIFFHLPYCYRCKEMERKVYSKPDVIECINRNFIPVMVNVDKEKSVKEAFKITYTPTHVFLSPQGEEILRVKDIIPLSRFKKLLRYVAGGYYKETDFESYLKGGA